MPRRPPVLTFSLLADVARYGDPDRVISVDLGAEDEVVALLAREVHRPEGPTSMIRTALFVRDGVGRQIPIEPSELVRAPTAQPFGDGGLLLVDRVRIGSSANASVFDPNGQLVSQFAVGDGVQEVQVADDVAWVSYFDEGVFSNDPLSNTGLNAFDLQTGERTWAYSADRYGEPISDCYALNVDRHDAWAYYYTPFDLIHIDRNGRLERWRTTVRGAKGVAVGRFGVLLLGTYEDWATASLWKLGLGRLERASEVEVERPDRMDTPRVVSRGDRIYAVYRDACYVGTLSDP